MSSNAWRSLSLVLAFLIPFYIAIGVMFWWLK